MRRPPPATTKPHTRDLPPRSELVFRRLFVGLLTAIVAAAAAGLLGGRIESTRAADGATELAVSWPRTTRPGLPAELRIVVGGRPSTGPVRIGVSAAYADVFHGSSPSPQPLEEANRGADLVLSYDAPDDGPLTVSIAGRTAAGLRGTIAGRVSVLDRSGRPLASVRVSTTVLP